MAGKPSLITPAVLACFSGKPSEADHKATRQHQSRDLAGRRSCGLSLGFLSIRALPRSRAERPSHLGRRGGPEQHLPAHRRLAPSLGQVSRSVDAL